MSHKSNLLLPISAILASSAFMLTSCSDDEVQEINQGREIAFTTQISRATPTTLSNLEAFNVWADADGWTSFLIDGKTATKDDKDGSSYSLPHNYYWPNEVEYIKFWAYGPTSGTNAVTITPSFDHSSQSLKDFEVTQEITSGGINHQDLVVAYTNAKRSTTSGTTVSLQFKHALSQIEVKACAGQADVDNTVIKIKGAWIVNAKSKGQLDFANTGSFSWSSNTFASYGVEFTTPTTLNSTYTTLIGNKDGSSAANDQKSLMLIPQEITGLTFDKSAHTNNSGTYIMLLCRIDIEHDGNNHEGAMDDSYGVSEDGKKHYHQLFPVSSKYDNSKYGYTCVPISSIIWQPGKKYIYNLEICGDDSGAGVYPPDPKAPFDPTITPPDGKNPGDAVLDKPIKFSVSVDEWTSDSNPAQEVTPTIP